MMRYHSHDYVIFMAKGRLPGWALSNHMSFLEAEDFFWLAVEGAIREAQTAGRIYCFVAT